MNAAEVIEFRFDTNTEVRVTMIDDEPWFVAVDVCRILGQSNTTKALQSLDNDERSNFKLGRQGSTNIINESGLYTLILRCDDAIKKGSPAHTFRKWVTAEVLPSIRKKNRYDDEQGKMATLIGETIGTDGFHMLGALIKGKVSSLPAAVQRKAKAKIWSQTHAAFGVRSAADIPASQLDSARNFIAAYALEGEWLPKDARPKILARDHRVLGYLDLNGVERWEEIAAGAYILTRREFIDSMLVHCDMPVTTDEMFEFAQLALANLNSRSNCMAAQLKALRKRD